MAKVNIPSDELNFKNQLAKVKMEIGTRFRELFEILKEREKELLRKLEEIETNHKFETDKQKQILSELNLSIKEMQKRFTNEFLKDIQSEIIKQINDKQKEIESELKSQLISFGFNNTLFDRISGFGKISVVNSSYSCLPVIDYKGKVKPVVSVGTRGSGEGQFRNPYGIAVDYRADNI
ncbi:hypothetical protein LOD99_10417 [Oopsacas minuta]|uniref:Uncharacterized protein n=1 Tax=Oopsacas minuta TaxID=111878 RepID=A0AAV7KI85_9METZ|nr:hypothetical protein LOD99_10417 [Oopsacas minuta]